MAKLPLDDGPEALAYRALCRVLKSDPTLQRIGMRWRDWQDGEKDIAEISQADMPLAILTPRVESQGWWSEGEQSQGLVVEAAVFLAGTHMDDPLNLLNAFRAALWPADPARRAAVSAILSAACAQGQVRPGAFAPAVAKGDARILAGSFEFQLLQLVNT